MLEGLRTRASSLAQSVWRTLIPTACGGSVLPISQSERWAHHIYRGILAQSGDVFYLADATADGHAKTPEAPFVGGLFELLQGEA